MKGIIMGADSVRAILDGRKTQTRRVVNKKALDRFKFSPSGELLGSFNESHPEWEIYPTIDDAPYKVGDRLWVRETYCTVMGGPPFGLCFYRADSESIVIETKYGTQYMSPDWKSPMFMPKAMSRITLEVTNIRVERVQDITEDEAMAEGIEKDLDGWKDHTKRFANHPEYPAFGGMFRDILPTAINSYKKLWDSINGKKHPWESNPWVFVYTFKVVEGKV